MSQFLNIWLLGPLFSLLACALFALGWNVYVKFRDRKREMRRKAMDSSGEGERDNPDTEEQKKPLLPTQRAEGYRFLRPKEEWFDLSFLDLGLRVNGRAVLEGVTGEIKHGRMTAVMGPSGSGKTTFLSTLSGRVTQGEQTGVVKINGWPDSLQRYKRMVGFVPQDDVMIRTLTVRELLTFSAHMRLPRSLNSREKEGIVDDVLDLLSLTEIQHSIIGDEDRRGISGGQRKRVNIGIEMVADPCVLFLDEPTSGLDSSSSREVCLALRNLAHKLGLTVVAVIHQPRYEIFSSFDDVLLLGKGGHTVYLGAACEAKKYFQDLGYAFPAETNPADYLMDIVAGDVPHPSQNGKKHSSHHLFEAWRRRGSDPLAVFVMLDDTADGDAMAGAHIVSASGSTSAHTEEVEKRDVNVQQSGGPVFPMKAHGKIAPPTVPIDFVVPNGTVGDFVLGLCACVLMPYFLPLFLFKQASRRAHFGAIIGTSFASFASVFLPGLFGMLAQFLTHNDTSGVSLFYGAFFTFCAMIAFGIFLFGVFVFSVYRCARGGNARFIGNFLCGLIMGPFWLVPFWHSRSEHNNPQNRYAALCGWAVICAALGFMFVLGNIGWQPWLYFINAVAPLCGIAMLIVFQHRYKRLPAIDRQIAWLPQQVWRVFCRSIIQQTRSFGALFFDLALVVGAGTFLGVIYFNRYYQPPLLQSLPGQKCPSDFPQQVCLFLELPKDDPIVGEASLTCLSLALAAVASSLRVFGSETTVFKRESSSGISTEAYYIGKSLAHLPMEILPPLLFCFFFYSLTQPPSSFLLHFALFFLVYYICTGMAFLISIVVPATVSQLVGVLCVLVSMMFSGANPSLLQLRNNELIPEALFYPSYLSTFRWGLEAYYLIEIQPFNAPTQTMSDLYGYSFDDWISCWTLLLFLAFSLRLAAYVALVKKEQ